MIRKTILEAVSLLLLALVLALLYHLVSPSGVTIFKKKTTASPATQHPPGRGGVRYAV
jgi:hypothetical protein